MKRICILFLSCSVYFYPMQPTKEKMGLKMPILYPEEVVQSLKEKLKESEQQLKSSYLYQDIQADLILLTNANLMRQIMDLTNLQDNVIHFIATSQEVIACVEGKESEVDIAILKQKIANMKAAITYITPTVSK